MRKTLFSFLLLAQTLFGANECLSCHGGIEKIRHESSDMMQAILEVSQKAGHVGNDCIVCHGGNPQSNKKSSAHSGTVEYFKTNKGPKEFYSQPSHSDVNKNTCGACHENQVASATNSLMSTNQEKIQETLKSFGADRLYSHALATNKTQNPDASHKRFGSEAYQKYMQKLESLEPQAFAQETKKLPSAATPKELQKKPELSAFSYLNQEVLKDTKELNCASCHLPRNKEGKLIHSIQSSRKTTVKVDDKEYSGVSIATCVTCHKSEKSIATSYSGLIEKESSSTKKYVHMQEDVHFRKGMLCQDCHTSNDLHGDGFLNGAAATAVEIECQDCHGTTNAYPWELPLGYSDEFNTSISKGAARGTTKTVAEYLKQGSVAEVQEGYLLSSRGNPLPHATKEGNTITLHLASGKNIELQPLKKLKKDKHLSKKALLAMDSIDAHTQNLECYTCHATWAPQFYDNHLKIDYSEKKSSDARVSELKGFMRWEEPTLMQNAEGRISPSVPKYEAKITVVGEDSSVILYKNPHAERLALSALQPHTVQKEARSCESCHTNPKAMGMDISGLRVEKTELEAVDENTSESKGFKLLAPLSQEQKDKLDRSGICLSCHQDIPKGNLAISAMHHITKMAEINIDNDQHKSIVNKQLNIGIWAQVLGAAFVLIFIVIGIYILFFKKQPKNPRNEGWK